MIILGFGALLTVKLTIQLALVILDYLRRLRQLVDRLPHLYLHPEVELPTIGWVRLDHLLLLMG